MRQALRNVGAPDHLALAYAAWVSVGDDGKIPDSLKARWLEELEHIGVPDDYSHSFARWKESFSSPGDRLATLTLNSRLLVGHGNPSAVDVGLSVHHTWGVPIIPGSALKGLVAHYVDATYGPSPNTEARDQQGDERVRADYQGVTRNRRRIERGPGEIHRALFGAPDVWEADASRQRGASTGLVTFHDALYVPDSVAGHKPFAADVLTVHQKRYYNSSGSNYPSDYDDPNPVAFLTVRPKVVLQLALSGGSDWTELAGRLLKDALETWGVGGKTSAGYGIGQVSPWGQPARRPSKTEQMVSNLEKYGEDALRGDLERWLRGEPVPGPLKDLLSTPPGATNPERRALVRELGLKFAFRDTWSNRLNHKKADEMRKARARALIEAWDKLFAEPDHM